MVSGPATIRLGSSFGFRPGSGAAGCLDLQATPRAGNHSLPTNVWAIVSLSNRTVYFLPDVINSLILTTSYVSLGNKNYMTLWDSLKNLKILSLKALYPTRQSLYYSAVSLV